MAVKKGIKSFVAGKTVKRYQYYSFEPELMNRVWEIDSPDLSLLLSKADRKLGELNAFGQLIPDVDFFIKMHVLKEGTTSSRIEGTQTSIEEAIQKEEFILPEKKDDWQEIQNYVLAMNAAIRELDTLPLSSRLLRNTHKVLMQGVRGRHKQPGEFRSTQNWIGGSSIADAKFIPPHQDGVMDLMSDLDNFLNSPDTQLPHLVKVGIAHYQFETIHPFLDGNGRMGRLLITLYLVTSGLLTKPTLYLSDFFEKNKEHYYDNLNSVRTHNDLEQWLRFFLVGITVTAENSIHTFKQIIALRTQCETKILTLGKRQELASRLLQYLYAQPILDMKGVTTGIDINNSTASRLVQDFVRLGILTEITGNKRNRIFSFEQYLSLFR